MKDVAEWVGNVLVCGMICATCVLTAGAVAASIAWFQVERVKAEGPSPCECSKRK